MEEWKGIDGYETLYEVSSLGRVRSTCRPGKRHTPYILSPLKAGGGGKYRKISINVGGKCKSRYIHRLVAFAFLPNPNGYLEVNHLDGVPSNNVVTNLEWCDKRHNHLHAYAIGLQKPITGEDVHTHVFTEREALFLRYIKGIYPQIRNIDIAKFYGVSWRAVENIWIGKTWKHL
jgi:hypothetical protein